MSDFLTPSAIQEIPVVKEDRKYWLVRTSGGDHYEKFIEGEYIGMNYEEITLEDIFFANKDNVGLYNLGEKIKKTYEDETRPTHIANQLIRFAYGIKAGDIVFIPNESSVNLYFGEVLDDAAYIEENPTDGCPYRKRKKVRWIKSELRRSLDASFYKLMFSHQTITDASEFADEIDRIFHSLYIKGDKANIVLNVTTEDDIKARTFYGFGQILPLLDDYCQEEQIPNTDDYSIKTDVHSPGVIVITSLSIVGLIALGLIVVSIAGGSFHFTHKSDGSTTEAGLKTDGIIERIRGFLNSRSNRQNAAKIIDKAIEEMGITTPEELVKIIKEMKNK